MSYVRQGRQWQLNYTRVHLVFKTGRGRFALHYSYSLITGRARIKTSDARPAVQDKTRQGKPGQEKVQGTVVQTAGRPVVRMRGDGNRRGTSRAAIGHQSVPCVGRRPLGRRHPQGGWMGFQATRSVADCLERRLVVTLPPPPFPGQL